MGYYAGKDGQVEVDDRVIAKVSSWSLSANVESLEVTSLDDIARDYTPGLKSANGSLTCWYYDNAPVRLLSKVIQTGEVRESDKVKLTLRWGPNRVTCTALLTSGELACQVGEVMQAQLSFTVCGDFSTVKL